MIVETSPYKVFALSQGGELAKRMCEYLGCSLGNIQVARFSDGEFAVSFEESVRGQSVYIVQSTCPSSDNIMELLLAIDAAKRASAYKQSFLILVGLVKIVRTNHVCPSAPKYVRTCCKV